MVNPTYEQNQPDDFEKPVSEVLELHCYADETVDNFMGNRNQRPS